MLLEPPDDPTPLLSVVDPDAVQSVSVATLVERSSRLSGDRMRQIGAALEIAVGCQG